MSVWLLTFGGFAHDPQRILAFAVHRLALVRVESSPYFQFRLDSEYVARSSAIAARMVGDEMMIMAVADSTLFCLNDVVRRDLARRGWQDSVV